MDPCPLRRSDAILDDVDEGRGVVVGDGLACIDIGHEGCIDVWCPLAAGLRIGNRHDAQRRQRLGSKELDLEHGPESCLVAEQRGHVLG